MTPYTADPNGIMSNPTAGSLVPVQQTAQGNSNFAVAMAGLLNQLQQQQATGLSNLGGAKGQITNQSVTTGPGFNPNIDVANNVQNMQTAQNAFAPQLKGLGNYMENFATNSGAYIGESYRLSKFLNGNTSIGIGAGPQWRGGFGALIYMTIDF